MLNAKGIYAYRDIDTNQIVYVGLTTQSFNVRHKQHLVSKKNNLFENKLQKHPDKYELIPLLSFFTYNVSHDELSYWEKYYIKQCKTYHKINEDAFNLTIGGTTNYPKNARKNKYTIFDSSKVHYLPNHLYHNNEKGDNPKNASCLDTTIKMYLLDNFSMTHSHRNSFPPLLMNVYKKSLNITLKQK